MDGGRSARARSASAIIKQHLSSTAPHPCSLGVAGLRLMAEYTRAACLTPRSAEHRIAQLDCKQPHCSLTRPAPPQPPRLITPRRWYPRYYPQTSKPEVAARRGFVHRRRDRSADPYCDRPGRREAGGRENLSTFNRGRYSGKMSRVFGIFDAPDASR